MDFPDSITTFSANETERLGASVANKILEDASLPRFVAMYGDLGVGKTAFVRGFCSVICNGVTVKSPTFALVNEYKCSIGIGGIKRVCHFDMYRIADEDDLYSIGFYDYLRDDSLCIAEWCELIPYALPERYIKVEIAKMDMSDKRTIKIDFIA